MQLFYGLHFGENLLTRLLADEFGYLALPVKNHGDHRNCISARSVIISV
jgi:hypothetical protein